MKNKLQLFLLFIGLAILMSSCSINNNLMLKTHKGFVFDTIPENSATEYIVSPQDIINFRLFANDGFSVIDLASGTGSQAEGGTRLQANNANFMSYLIKDNGMVRLPMLGEIKIAGLSIIEAESLLENSYAKYYKEPWVQVTIKNRRVIVFPGNGSGAKTVPLPNNNTTLMETIASVGGIAERGRANKVKILRKVGDKREVYLVDLSTIDGLDNVDMIMQANDIVYIEPVPEIARAIVKDIAPILSLVSSVWLIYVTFRNIQ